MKNRKWIFASYQKLETALLPRNYLVTVIESVHHVSLETFMMDDNYALDKVDVLLDKVLEKKVPLAYLVGYQTFMGCQILVNPDVLIPRVESEFVVTKTYESILKLGKGKLKVLDLCTGSGCLLIGLSTLLKDFDVEYFASDISKKALDVAKTNFKAHNLDVTIFCGDLLQEVTGQYDVIISNPPYLDAAIKLEDIVTQNEPSLALYAEDQGLFLYKQIIDNVENYLQQGGIVCFEIGHDQGEILKQYASDFSVEFEKDLFLNDRFLMMRGK